MDSEAGTQGVPYDYESIMHYSAFSGTKNKQRVIVPLGNIPKPLLLGKLDYPSEYDYLHVNLLYCKGEHIHVNI